LAIKFKKFNIEAYEPGKSSIKRFNKVIKLSANESALGVSAKAKKAISNEIIQMLCQLFLKPKDEVILPQFSFLMYRIYAKIVGAKVVFAKEKNFKVSVSEIIKKVTNKTKIVFLANPNNPTGTYLNSFELIDLRKRLRKNILLVVDDAYAEYMQNRDFISRSVKHNHIYATKLKNFLSNYDISSNKVSANFLLLNFNKCKLRANSFYEKLKKKGIILRSTEEGYKIKNMLRLKNVR